MATERLTITEFLLARIAEDEREVQYLQSVGIKGTQYGSVNTALDHVIDMAMDACRVKRRIVELHQSWPVLVERPVQFEPSLGAELAFTDQVSMRASQQIQWMTEQAYRDAFGDEPPTAPMLHALAAVYADHPDYDEAWWPST